MVNLNNCKLGDKLKMRNSSWRWQFTRCAENAKRWTILLFW